MTFEEKVVVVTGGSNGIGKGIVEAFMIEGAKVIVIDKEKQNTNCDFYFQGDLSKKEVLIEFSKSVIQRYRRIDYLINNACLNKKGVLSDCSYEDFNYVFNTGVTEL
jgi:NAD(P)-dependent dehydrogenase (short-subunit alcohol dehydrogenase family)